jgi:CubicO group peptidase (beta-lactamase class C family)
MRLSRPVFCWTAAALTCTPAAPLSAQSGVENRIDALFKDFVGDAPGCAVGVYRAGEIVFSKKATD